MAGRSRGRNSNGWFHNSNLRRERSSDHDDQISRPSTSRGRDGYSDLHGLNKKVTFKANHRGGVNFRKSCESKTDLVINNGYQLDSEFPNSSGPPRNNTGQRNLGHGGNSNFRNLSQDLKESRTGWYSVSVLNVEDCEEVLKMIQTYITPFAFYPYNKQYFDNGLSFLVDDFKIANTLYNTNYKITQRDDRKLIINVELYLPQHYLISYTPVSSELREKMIEAIATRYNHSNKSLDLSQFHACSLFTNNQLFVPLNRPAVLLAALNMVAQHTKHDLYSLCLENNHIYLNEGLVWIRRLFPELKVLDLAGNKFSDLKHLRCLSGYTIRELNLSRNPMCNTEDKERYKRDVQQLFPMLNKLDNSELPFLYSGFIGSKLKMPINLGNSYPIPEGHNPELPNPVMTFVESFLNQYYVLYDNQVSRQIVSVAYHEKATFTLSSYFPNFSLKKSALKYHAESRNFLKFDQNRHGRRGFLHKGKEDIINFLDKLPKTKHDIGSFIVDVPLETAAMIQIVVNGVFVENFIENNYYDKFTHTYRPFCRTFCLVPVGSGWSIISDMLYVTKVTHALLLETAKRFNNFKLKPVSSKRNNLNGSSNQKNATILMEDTDVMAGMESSSSYQQHPTPSYLPSSYQQSTFSSFQSTSMTASINPQQPSHYQGGMHTSTP
ncbi:unnamed protein product [Macrosiphum euphorbiae]|uniref:NTF2 domain-containing protein n=1 Tax=Macrosiphum euphorbiae TaxID=13131 RepID=A0AAV0WNQ9_9HEMI|nr:unnamed protein product [Macrosiphum euphorbiae]